MLPAARGEVDVLQGKNPRASFHHFQHGKRGLAGKAPLIPLQD